MGERIGRDGEETSLLGCPERNLNVQLYEALIPGTIANVEQTYINTAINAITL